MANNHDKYKNHTREELIDELETLKKKKYGLVWDKKNSQEMLDAFVNWENVPENFTPKQFPVLKEIKNKEIETDKKQAVNLLIEGDNYHSLAVLNFTHQEKIDFVYIDPPYNTGNKDFIYNDKFVDREDPFRHSKWLSFMEKRLRLAFRLLKNTGVIFISIDDNEQAQLKLLCDEVFGENNFVTTIHVQMSTVSGQKVRAAKGGNIVKNAEYILVYSKSGKKNIGENLLYDPVEYDTHYSIFLTPASKGIWEESSFIDECINNKEIFNILLSSGLASIKNGKKSFSIGNLQKAYSSIEKFRDFVHKNADRIVRTDRMIEVESAKLEKNIKPNTTYTYLHKSGKSYLYGIDKKGEMKQRFLLSEKVREADDFYKTYGITNLRGDWWSGFHLDMGNVPKEGGVDFLNGKKPVRLIKQLINYCLDENGIILDFFAGSGTTAQAVLEINNDKKYKHKFILCTNNENNICDERTLPRIKNVINGYSGKSGLGGNLKYFKTDFVGSDSTDKNKRDLVNKSAEMICIKEDIFDLIVDGGLDYKIYQKDKKFLGIIFDLDSISDFKKEAEKHKGNFIVYCFSYTEATPEKEFKGLKNKYVLKPIPAVILRIYMEIFKK
jgi:adenine-specific DNA-methyltransferase